MSNPKDYLIHMIGHGHIDPTWLWAWQEGYEEVRATFRSALARMEECADFKFSASSACFYRWMKTSEPEAYEQVRKRIQEGRWELVGGFWVEPDCNIPCGEAFVRQGLYSQLFFQKEFGKRARVGFNPDSFGHTGMLPQILKQLGMDYYVYMRPDPIKEKDYPEGATFWWESPDGSRVLASHLPETYVTEDSTAKRIRRLPKDPTLNQDQKNILCFYGVGNHGGGPTKKSIAEIQEAGADPEAPRVCFSFMEEYFHAFLKEYPAEEIPKIQEDLQHHARGCYSAHAALKYFNRRVEHELMGAERFATAAWLLAEHPYPEEALRESWLDLLYNQFHDILAGTSLASTYEDTRDQLGAARHRAQVIMNQSVQTIARTVDTTPEGNTVIVVNPLTWPVEQVVTVQPIVTRTLKKPVHFVNEDEMVVPSQQVRHERPDDARYSFVADLPAMGYRCYHCRSDEKATKATRRLEVGRSFLENEWWRIEIDPYDGVISRLFDKHQKLEVLHKGAILAAMADGSDTWSHDLRGYRTEAGRFGAPTLRVVEEGDVLATVQITSTYNKSTAIQEITLYRDLNLIDISLRVNWQEAYTTLKYAFESAIEEGVATYDTAYGHIVRKATGEEEPGQQWIDFTGSLGGQAYGLAILNDSKYGFDINKEGAMRVTVLRSPAYAHHDDARYDASQALPIMDQGWSTSRYRLVPHSGPWQDARIEKSAWELNMPLLAHIESAHPGVRPASATLMGTEAGNILISVVKKSELENDLIIRGHELEGKATTTTLHLPFAEKTFSIAFKPYEIKTVRISPENWTMEEVNCLEEVQ